MSSLFCGFSKAEDVAILASDTSVCEIENGIPSTS